VKRVSIFLIAVALIVGMVGYGGTCDTYNPPPSKNLEIRTWYDLAAVRDNLAGNHKLMNNLNSTTNGYIELASPTANGGKGWQPIGTETDLFTGALDGQGYEIKDLFINRPSESGVGLFGGVGEGVVIKNLGVVNVTVTGMQGVGGLVGGGDGNVSNSYSTGSVTGYGSLVGGLVGLFYGNVSNSHSTASITGNNSFHYVGGLVGLGYSVSNSYATGNVTGGYYVGGLVGGGYSVSNSYSTGSVSGVQTIGGLVGDAGGVSKSYSTGSVTGNSSVGGLVGENTGNVSDSFWDTETSGQATSAGGTGMNTTEMQYITTFSGAGWNITAVALNETNPAYIWNIVNNVTYPFLSWQP
jgi:hypothetical protein